MRDDNFRQQLHSNLDQKSTDELIEIWQTNNRVEWSEMTFEVIREILLERRAELHAQNEPITEEVDKRGGNEKAEKQNKNPQFNWKLPILGAIGFGISFALMGAIMLTIFNIAHNSFASAFDYPKVGMVTGAWRGIVVGGIGGAALGLALKDKTWAFHFSLAGAIGFGTAFALVISIDSSFINEIGWTIIEIMRIPLWYLPFGVELVHGISDGTIIGGIGGLALGLATPKYRIISSLFLCCVGIISFSIIFTIGHMVYDGNFYASWNFFGGALGGALLGAALALYLMFTNWISRKETYNH